MLKSQQMSGRCNTDIQLVVIAFDDSARMLFEQLWMQAARINAVGEFVNSWSNAMHSFTQQSGLRTSQKKRST